MNIKSLYTAEQIQEAVTRVAGEVEAFFGKDEPVIALCLLNGAIWYAADLLRCLPANFELQTIRVSSYEGTESTGKLKWHNALPDCKGKHVLVIDDVLDTGLTMQAVCSALLENGAAKVASTVAINKKDAATLPMRRTSVRCIVMISSWSGTVLISTVNTVIFPSSATLRRNSPPTVHFL